MFQIDKLNSDVGVQTTEDISCELTATFHNTIGYTLLLSS